MEKYLSKNRKTMSLGLDEAGFHLIAFIYFVFLRKKIINLINNESLIPTA